MGRAGVPAVGEDGTRPPGSCAAVGVAGPAAVADKGDAAGTAAPEARTPGGGGITSRIGSKAVEVETGDGDTADATGETDEADDAAAGLADCNGFVTQQSDKPSRLARITAAMGSMPQRISV
jgi:hypothetical protein